MYFLKGPECAQVQPMPKDTYSMLLCTINIRDKTSQNAVPNYSAEENVDNSNFNHFTKELFLNIYVQNKSSIIFELLVFLLNAGIFLFL